MSEQTDFERAVAQGIASEHVAAAPSDAFFDDLISRAGRSGQRPEWLALLKEPPMRHTSSLAVGSPTARIAAIVAATVLLLTALVGAGIAGSRLLAANGIIVVDPSGNGTTTTIQDALAMADDGDEIVVRPGIYDAPITITDDVILRGEDRESVILKISPDGPTLDHFWYGPLPYGVLVEDSAAEISGLTIQGTGPYGSDETSTAISVVGGSPLIHDVTTDSGNGAAVYYQGAASGELRDSSLQGLVAVQDASTPTIANNDVAWHIIVGNPVGTDPVVINENRLSGIAIVTPDTNWLGEGGPALVASNTLRIHPDAAEANEDFLGIDIVGSVGSIVRGNDIAGFQEGIKLREGSSSVLEGNTLTDNETAIVVLMGEPRIVSNTIRGGSVGINVTGGAELTDNHISGVSGRGIAVGFGGATLRGNTSCGNGEDLFWGTDPGPVIDESNEICVMPADG
jgi:parallel beta-helix repeat protein